MRNNTGSSSRKKFYRIGILTVCLVLLAAGIGVSAKYVSERSLGKRTLQINANSVPVVFSAIPSVPDQELKAGDEFSVSMSISGNYYSHALDFGFEYDTERVDFVSMQLNDVAVEQLTNAGCTVMPSRSKPRVNIIGPQTGFNCEGVIFDATFRVKDNTVASVSTGSGSEPVVKITPVVTKFSYVPQGTSDHTGTVDIPYKCEAAEFVLSIPETTEEPSASPDSSSYTAAPSDTPDPQTVDPNSPEPDPESSDEPDVSQIPDETEAPATVPPNSIVDPIGSALPITTGEPEDTSDPN